MGKLFERIQGAIRLEITGAFPESVLNNCALAAIEFWDLQSVDTCTVRLSIFERQLEEFTALCQRCMCEMQVLRHEGGSKNKKFLSRRIWLLVSAAIVAGLLVWSSLYIWQIEIHGCENLTAGQVLRALEECGVEEGTYWPSLSTDLVRSRMLMRLPELAWMTVNVSGSRAVVLVSERQEKPEIYLESEAADIIAKKTGIISKMSVLNGQPLVRLGQSVIAGETLVSGVMESITSAPRLARAEAEIMADTWYEITALAPVESQKKLEEKRSLRRFAIKFGENRINLYFGSGKYIDECDKIVNEYNLGVDGLFALPISLVRVEYLKWEKEPGQCADEQAMKDWLLAALAEQIDGEIISSSFSVSKANGVLKVTLIAQCRENIAQSIDIT